MDAPLKPAARLLLWDYERVSSPYVLLCVALLLLILAVPPEWLGDPMAVVR